MTTANRLQLQGLEAAEPDPTKSSSSLEIVRLVADTLGHLEHFQLRVVQDALAEADSGYWKGRAAALLAARPHRWDYNGNASREALRARYDRLTEMAAACEAASQVVLIQPIGDVQLALDHQVGDDHRGPGLHDVQHPGLTEVFSR